MYSQNLLTQIDTLQSELNVMEAKLNKLRYKATSVQILEQNCKELVKSGVTGELLFSRLWSQRGQYINVQDIKEIIKNQTT
jgi:prefoldin subunit 5